MHMKKITWYHQELNPKRETYTKFNLIVTAAVLAWLSFKPPRGNDYKVVHISFAVIVCLNDFNDYVMIWKHFPHYWSLWIPHTKGEWCRTLMMRLLSAWLRLWTVTLVEIDFRRWGAVSLRLMTSPFKDIINHTQQWSIKCIFCGVWVRKFMWNFKGTLWNFIHNFEPIHRKICFLRNVKIWRMIIS